MALRKWTGAANDGNLANSGNYDAFPTSGDGLLFANGYISITAGTNALSGIPLSTVTINEGFRATQFGTAASPVKLNCGVFKVATNTLGLISVVGQGNFDQVKVEKLAGANMYIGAGTPRIESIELGSGAGLVDVASDVKVDAVRSAGIHVKLGPVASGAPDMVANVGKTAIVEAQRKVAQSVVNGTLKVTESGSIDHTTPDSCFCVVADGGRLNFAATGTFRRVERLPGSLLDFDDAKQDVAITEDIPYAGATLKPPQGITVTVSATVPIGNSPIPRSA